MGHRFSSAYGAAQALAIMVELASALDLMRLIRKQASHGTTLEDSYLHGRLNSDVSSEALGQLRKLL